MTRQEKTPEMHQHRMGSSGPPTPTSTSSSLTSKETLVADRLGVSSRPIVLDDPKFQARKWPIALKLAVSIGAISSFLVVTLATSIYIASIPGIMAEFQVGRTLAILPVTLYALGFVVGPVLTSALSEEFGRQYIYKTALLLHLVFTIVGALARNFTTVAVCRAMAGLAGSPSVSVFAGVLNDLWQIPGDTVGVRLFVLYGLGGAAAPTIGPIVGESVVASFGWRSTFWLTAILVGSCFVGMLFVPETFTPERKSLGPVFLRPFRLLFGDPIVFLTVAVVTMSQAIVFVFYESYPVVLQRTYGFTPYQTGLAFLPLLGGTLLVAPVLLMVERWKRALDRPTPEDSLPGAMLAAILLPVSLLWLAWTVRQSIHWICPLLSGVLYGMGFALSQLVYPLYKNEIYGAELGASSMAVDVAMRYSVSSVFPLFTIQLIDAIGFGWTMTACAIIMAALGPIPWVLRRMGPSLRARSRYI